MHDQEQQLQQRLTEIGNRYLRRTLGEMQRLREIAASAGPKDAASVTEIVQIAHRMHGGGGMFGFDSISEVASRLETAARDWLQSVESQQTTQPQIDSLLTELERTVHNTAQQQGLL